MFVDVFKGWAQIDSLLLIAGLLVAMSRLPAPAPPRRGTAGALVPGWIPHPPVREMVG
ncbi:MAG: hypothetical protein QJR03_09525 [Sphaerobacter sp.]|nr:hypothetical protein [Sphaerobacter sp.]